jgi:hypothetical protein
MAGVSFEHIARLATPQTLQVARDLLGQGNQILEHDKARLGEVLERELTSARNELYRSATAVLPLYLVFAAEGARERLLGFLRRIAGETPPKRRKEVRAIERTLVLYLQRIAAKNDSFSMFGPSGWGTVEPIGHQIALSPEAEIAKREFYLERWTAHGIAAAINSDPEVSEKIAVPALDAHAFDTLMADVTAWPDGPTRSRWLGRLEPIAALPAKFAESRDATVRVQIMDEARQRLRQLGSNHATTNRFLYAAINPIGEECLRECNFVIGREVIDEVTTEAAPWIDLWRDSYAYIASRVAGGLRNVLERMSIQNGTMPLPDFLRACETAKLPLTGSGLVALAHMAFQEVKAVFREQMRAYIDDSEHELTVEECQVVRRKFQYPPFDDYTYPSADLQLSAESPEAVGRGDYQWILAELHPPAALLQHGFYWSCPDKAALREALARAANDRPNFHYGIHVADFTAATCVELMSAMPDLAWFVAPQRANPQWRIVRPENAEVYVDCGTGDVRLRETDSHQYLGSFARNWIISLGFHPFQFGMTSQMPRLRCGKIIVQRRAWVVTAEEFGRGNYAGISPDLVLAIERLRALRDFPRYVYIRPTEQALRRSGAEGRDKDTKPVFVDLESYLFMEIFHRWLTKAGEVEVIEMLPDPNHLLWKERDGRRTFELRTLIVPRR